MENKKIYILGGGTFSHVRNHMALSMPAFGTTANKLEQFCHERFKNLDIIKHLTAMAGGDRNLVTNEDVEKLTVEIKSDFNTKIVFFNVGLCDFDGQIGDIESGKYAERLKSAAGETSNP